MTVNSVIDKSQKKTRSGKPKEEGFEYSCTWFAGATPRYQSFDEELLEKVEPDAKKK